MELRIEGLVGAAAAAARGAVADLTTYPSWLTIVRRVGPDGDGWLVDVGAKVGPLTRTKRVRMVRDGELAFTRQERDGRDDHGRWDLVAAVEEVGPASTRLVVTLAYAGSSPLVSLLEPLLRAEAARAIGRLEHRLTEPSPPP